VLFTGDGISHCNTKHVIATLVQILDELEHGSHLALGRVKDCVRPTQLERGPNRSTVGELSW
jgi:hypothetical protein